MARTHRSHRRAPPPSPTRPIQSRDSIDISGRGSSHLREQQHLTMSKAGTTIPNNKRHADGAVHEQHQPKMIRLTSPRRTNNATALNEIRETEVDENNEARPMIELAHRHRRLTKSGPSHPDASTEQFMMGETSIALPPARFEANEMHRVKKYKRETELGNEIHDRTLGYSSIRNKTLVDDWGSSKAVLLSIGKNGKPATHTITKAEASVKKIQNQDSLKGEGKLVPLPPLSPVLPIRDSDSSDYESLVFDSEAWPSDFPEPTIDRDSRVHVPFPPVAKNPQLDRHFDQEHVDGARATTDQTLGERFLAFQGHAATEEENEMSIEEMSDFIKFDTEC